MIAGVTGPTEPLEGTTGLLGRIPFVALPGFFTGLGRAWLTETLSVKVKVEQAGRPGQWQSQTQS